jgi:hypothetical protein
MKGVVLVLLLLVLGVVKEGEDSEVMITEATVACVVYMQMRKYIRVALHDGIDILHRLAPRLRE